MSDECYKGGKKHKFEARYTELTPRAYDYEEIKKLKTKLYVYDICLWCGKIANREDNKCHKQ